VIVFLVSKRLIRRCEALPGRAGLRLMGGLFPVRQRPRPGADALQHRLRAFPSRLFFFHDGLAAVHVRDAVTLGVGRRALRLDAGALRELKVPDGFRWCRCPGPMMALIAAVPLMLSTPG